MGHIKVLKYYIQKKFIELNPNADGSDVSANKQMRNKISIFGNSESERGSAQLLSSRLTARREARQIKQQSGLPGSKKFKRPNLAISSFKKGQILINKKGQIKAKFPSKFLL